MGILDYHTLLNMFDIYVLFPLGQKVTVGALIVSLTCCPTTTITSSARNLETLGWSIVTTNTTWTGVRYQATTRGRSYQETHYENNLDRTRDIHFVR